MANVTQVVKHQGRYPRVLRYRLARRKFKWLKNWKKSCSLDPRRCWLTAAGRVTDSCGRGSRQRGHSRFPRGNRFPRLASTCASVPSAARQTRRATCPDTTDSPRVTLKLAQITCHHRSRWIIDAVLFTRRRGGDAVEGGGEAASGARWVYTK